MIVTDHRGVHRGRCMGFVSFVSFASVVMVAVAASVCAQAPAPKFDGGRA
jgi:hypothetical protein